MTILEDAEKIKKLPDEIIETQKNMNDWDKSWDEYFKNQWKEQELYWSNTNERN